MSVPRAVAMIVATKAMIRLFAIDVGRPGHSIGCSQPFNEKPCQMKLNLPW